MVDFEFTTPKVRYVICKNVSFENITTYDRISFRGGGHRGDSPSIVTLLLNSFAILSLRLALAHMHNCNRLICVLHSETASSGLK